jgi:SM-20-related protein
MDLDYAALRASPVVEDPFPHVVVGEFVPPTSLRAVVRDFPAIAKGGSFPPESVQLGPEARALVQAMEGPELRAAIAEKFGLDLSDSPTMLTVRGWTREKDGRIHCDSTAKRVTVLLYLNPPGDSWSDHQGCLRLLRGPDDIEDFAVEVPPVNGTLLAFPNGPTSWHGHKQYVGQRYSIQLNYMTTDQSARSELRRHRLSAVVKRLTRAA